MENFKPEICFFDSGIGGLSVLAAAAKKIPYAHFVYVADNYNVPYGNLTPQQISERAEKAFKIIASRNPAAAVIACNTVTACCVGELRQKYNFPIIGIQPAVKPACESGEPCAVLATEATANSKAMRELVEKYGNGRANIYPCPSLAAYIESDIFKIKKNQVINLLPQISARKVVLGCTHYIFVKDIIKEFYGCEIFDGVDGTVNRLINKIGGFIGTDLNGQPNIGAIEFIGGDSLKNRIIYEHLF